MFDTTTHPLIKHQLRALDHPPADWYKDEQGASNCMIVTGDLVDHAARRVLHSALPLRVVLVYEGGERLKDQVQ